MTEAAVYGVLQHGVVGMTTKKMSMSTKKEKDWKEEGICLARRMTMAPRVIHQRVLERPGRHHDLSVLMLLLRRLQFLTKRDLILALAAVPVKLKRSYKSLFGRRGFGR